MSLYYLIQDQILIYFPCFGLTIQGEPILNMLSEALDIMDHQSDDLLPYVVCEDWLFTKKKSPADAGCDIS